MSLESASFIADLVSTNPLGTDKRKLGDDHLRLIKAVLQSTFPNASTAFWFPRISAKSASFSITANDDNTTFLVDTTAGDVTVTVPAASGLNARFKCRIVKTSSDANKITFDPNSSETVNGAATLDILNQNIPVDFYCDATQWFAAAGGGTWTQLTTSTKTADYTVLATDAGAMLIANKATAITFTLPAATGNGIYLIRNIGAGDLTINRNDTPGTDTIEGASSLVVKTGHSVLVYSSAAGVYRVLYKVGQATDYLANNAAFLLSTEAVWKSAVPYDLGSSLTGTVTVDFSLFLNAKATLTGNVTLGSTSNLKKGQHFTWEWTQDGTGGRTVSLNSTYWETTGASGLVLSSGANKKDILQGYVQDNGKVFIAVVAVGVS